MILIIDDDVAVRTSLSLLLKQAGYATQSVATPEAALEVVRHTPPELVLMDMNYSLDTSGQDGLALLARTKELAPSVPVILITGWGSITLAVEGMKAGATEFITKPWNNDALLQTIRTILSLSEESGGGSTSSLISEVSWARMRGCCTCCATWGRWRPPMPPC